jgi:hypothetical protein
MNMIQLQDRLKGLSQDQLVQEMQMPTGQVPQFLVLSELTRRKKMEDSFAMEQGRDQSTVAQDAIAAAGMPAGFAGEMAGAMAPQTDMAGNTGAMPQQMAPMPEQTPGQMPVQGMAGGGIVALQEGSVGRGTVGSTPGGIVVRNGRPYVVDEEGNLVPAFTQPLTRSQSAMLDRNPPRPLTDDPEMSPPSIGDVPTMPSPLAAQPPLSMQSPPPQYDLPGGRPRELQPTLMDALGPLASPGPAPLEYLALSGNTGMPGSVLDSDMMRQPPAMPEYFGAAGEGFPVSDSISGAPAVADAAYLRHSGPGMAERHKSGQSGPIELGDRRLPSLPPSVVESIKNTAAIISPFASAEDKALAAAALGAQTTGTPLEIPEDPIDLLPPRQDAVETERPKPPAPPGGGGGIAAMAPQGAGAPTSFQQELMNMLEAREKRAVQDKWLALAQAGMALMSSKDPTFGGALGEAGQAGLGALRESRTTSEADRLGLLSAIEQSRLGEAQLELQRQALAARSAAGGGGGGGPSVGMSTDLQRQLNFLNGQLEAVSAMEMAGQVNSLDAKNERDSLQAQIRAIYQMGTGLPLGGTAPGVEFGN